MSIRIRIGAAYDVVETMNGKHVTAQFDRAEMRKNGQRNLVDRLRHEVRDTFAELHGFRKDKGAKRHQNQRKDKVRHA